jgi:ketosteroid isomerase-like protein
MNHELEVLEANESFYRAFSGRDVDALDRLWARRAPVACIHPGWDALDGREEVLDSFRAILGSGNSPRVRCTSAQARLLGEVAYVTCHEVLPAGRLVATNLFLLEDGAWRMVHHQATPLAQALERGQPEEPGLRS